MMTDMIVSTSQEKVGLSPFTKKQNKRHFWVFHLTRATPLLQDNDDEDNVLDDHLEPKGNQSVRFLREKM